MKLIKGDMWRYWDQADLFCFTSNGVIKANGALVMGAGFAKQVRERVPGVDLRLGRKIHRKPGNYKYFITFDTESATSTQVVAFQTKIHWKDKSDLDLIACSTAMLEIYAFQHPNKSIHLNYPGIGLGGLTRKQVEPIISVLPDNVHIHYL